jgi:hypothetical protein
MNDHVRGVIGVLDTSLWSTNICLRAMVMWKLVYLMLLHLLHTLLYLLVRTVVYRTVHASNRLSPHLAPTKMFSNSGVSPALLGHVGSRSGTMHNTDAMPHVRSH